MEFNFFPCYFVNIINISVLFQNITRKPTSKQCFLRFVSDNLIVDRMHFIPCFSNHSLLCYRVYDEHYFLHLEANYSWPIVAREKENSFLKSECKVLSCFATKHFLNRRLNLFSGNPFYPPISYPWNKKLHRGITANLGLF